MDRAQARVLSLAVNSRGEALVGRAPHVVAQAKRGVFARPPGARPIIHEVFAHARPAPPAFLFIVYLRLDSRMRLRPSGVRYARRVGRAGSNLTEVPQCPHAKRMPPPPIPPPPPLGARPLVHSAIVDECLEYPDDALLAIPTNAIIYHLRIVHGTGTMLSADVPVQPGMHVGLASTGPCRCGHGIRGNQDQYNDDDPASMGPCRCGHGIRMLPLRAILEARCFNGAMSLWTWNTPQNIGTRYPPRALQWGHVAVDME